MARPTSQELAFQHLESEVFIHYSIDTSAARDAPQGNTPASAFNPTAPAYRVHMQIGFTTVEISEPPFTMSVTKGAKAAPGAGTALMEAVLYREKGMLAEHCRYLLEALGQDNRPVSLVSGVDDFRAAIGFFFRSVLDTKSYQVTVLEASSLFGQGQF